MINLPLFFSNKYKQIKSFFVDISNEEKKLNDFSLTSIQSHSYINFDLTIEQKIEMEKRRRYQAYMTLDYLLSFVTYFDFFSVDSFKIAKRSKDVTQFFQKSIVTSDFLLLPFFEYNVEVVNILKKYGITENEVMNLLAKTNKKVDEKLQTKTVNSLKNFLITLEIPMVSNMLVVPTPTEYSYEVNQIFEKAAENALKRFKTPVISSEILLITMLEAKKSKVGKLLKHFLKSDINWYTFRYALMKRLHTQELAIRKDVPRNQQYFAYLLKTQLPEIQFDTLIEKDCLLPGVLLFRNNMIAEILKIDLYELLKADILASIKATKKRKYST